MSSSNKMTLAKLCKQHCTINHIRRCLSSAFTTIYGRKAKQSIAFGLLLLAGIFTTSVSAQTVVNICDRTTVVEMAILAAISPSPTCSTVTETQLAAITELDLSNRSMTALQSGDFANLTGLTTLRLQGNTFTTPLPANLFDDLPSAAVIEIDLSPIGDLADIALTIGGTTTINIANAFISKDAMGADRDLSFGTTLSGTSATVTVNEGVLTITASNTITGDTDVSITANDGTNDVIRTISVTVMGICSRTAQVRAAILASISGTSDCATVTATQLAAITGTLDLSSRSITTLQSGDFAGLTRLAGLFLNDNDLTTIEAGTFSGLTSLTRLDLFINDLTTIEANAFSDLTSLTRLSLSANGLTTIETNAFSGLTSLTRLDLFINDLTTIEADTFSALTSLTFLSLAINDLTTIEANAFSALTSLTFLGLNSNDLTTLEAGTFSGLTSLTELFLNGNAFITPLPADIFADLPSDAIIQIDLSPIGDLDEVALTVGGMTTINVANAFISRDDDGNRTLSYTVTPANMAVATATESSGVVTITGAGAGATTVSVTAEDNVPFGRNMFTRDIAVTVVEMGILAFDEATGNTAAAVVADENNGTDTFYVQLASPPTSDVTMTVMSSAIAEGTVTPSELTFTAMNWNTRQALTVTAIPDQIDRDDTFTVDFMITSGDGGDYPDTLTLSSVQVTITDDDTAGIDGYDALTAGNEISAITTSEGGDAITTYVELTSQPTGTVTVTIDGIDTTEHTLTTPASGTLTFDSTNWNTPRQLITITGQDDTVVDGDQTYTLTLTATGGGYDGVVETGLVTNTDDDTATLSIADATVNEGDTATLTVTLTPAVTAGDVMVNATIADGTAEAGTDYTTITSQTLTFTAGSTSETLDITISDDSIAEGSKNFTVMLDSLSVPPAVSGDVSITDATAIVTITDDDTLSDTINLSVSPLTVAETADATTITVTATIEGTAVSTTDTTVTVSVGGGTATSGTDYATVTDFDLTIPALSLSATQTFMIDPTEDTTDDNNEMVMITGTAGGFTTVNSATLTIVEAGISVHDTMTAGNPISTITIADENNGTGMLYVQLASQPATGSSVTISVASSDTGEGTITPPTLTFSDTNWNSRQPVTVTAVDDNIDRDGDSFMVNFAVMSGDGGNYTSSLMLPSVTVTVTDDDAPSDTINLSVSPLTIAETAGATTITVTAALGGALSTMPTEVTVIVGGGTDMNEATVTTDYTLSIPTATLTITIPALETSGSGTFTITPIADNENDNEETITISGTATGFSTINPATLTITGFSEEEQQVIEQTVAAQASSVTQVVSENIGSFLASRTSAPATAPAPPAPDGGGGGDVKRENFTSIDWQDWQDRFAKLAYEGIQRLDSDADMSLDWALKAAGGDGRLLMPLGVESLTLWAAGGRLKTKGDGMGNYDGGVNSFVVGVDTNLINNWLLGIAASYSDSQVDYTMDGAPIGSNEQNLFSVHPFLSHSLPDHGLTLWVTGGYGVGDIDFSHTTNGEAASDVTQWMAAGGIEKHIITNTLWQGALRLKGLWGNATVDATEYDNGVDIRKVESTFWRARMESEMGYNFQLPGANVRPYALIGGRWDHNDAIVSGDEWHIDIGGGVEVLSHNAFALNISVHTQVTDGDTEEDSIIGTGSFTYDIGHDRQGLQITLSRPLNNTSPAWDQHSFNEVTDTVSGVNSAPLTSELAYGWTVRPWGLEGALQTYMQNSFDSHDRHYAVGLELVVNALTLNFETGYGEADNTGLESLFKTKIRW